MCVGAFHGREAWAADRFDNLPQAQRVQSLQAELRKLGHEGRVSAVRWEPHSVLFNRNSEWFKVSLDGGEPSSVPEPDGATPPRVEPMDPPAGRAKQRTRVTSPDGKFRAVHRDGGVYVEEVSTEVEKVVKAASLSEPGVEYGTADWVYGEELEQNDAMWWSPDGRFLAFYVFDHSRVPTYELPKGWDKLRTHSAPRSYPKAGDSNAVVGLLIFDRQRGTLATVDVGDNPQDYIYGVQFTPTGSGLLFHRTNRRQDRLQILLADPQSGQTRVIVDASEATFHENRPPMKFLSDGDRFLWGTEKNGYRNLELRSLSNPESVVVLTQHAFPVHEVVRVDEPSGVVWYSAFSAPTPMLPQLHRVGLDGRGDQRITSIERGWSKFELSPDGTRLIARGETPSNPPITQLFAVNGTPHVLATLAQSDQKILDDSHLPPPELFTCLAADGTTPLWGTLFFPPEFDPTKRYPLVIDVYGGPHSQAVTGRFDPGPAERAFGVVMAKIDNRGTAGRGKAFESATYMKLGGPDADDQAAAVRALCDRAYIDGKHVGIFGHSYGGTMAATCALRYPQLFCAAVAGAPVTDWKNYDTIYTERWMRTPEENPAGYEAACLPCQAKEFNTGLLLLHGLEDDNVHPSNTMQLAKALQDADIPFEMVIFPTSGHGIHSPAYRSAKWSFLLDRLGVTAHSAADSPSTQEGDATAVKANP